jgi:hypothetical protein
VLEEEEVNNDENEPFNEDERMESSCITPAEETSGREWG